MSDRELERAQGSLLGAAVGDALGGPVEFMSPEEIASRYGTVREMIGGGSYNWKRGEYTDDTSMMLCIAESLLAQKKYHPEDIARRFVAWYESKPKDIGCTTREALSRLCHGVIRCDAGVKEKPTNGSVMRCAPLSIAFFQNEDKLVEASQQTSAITHRHIEAKLSCVFINVMIAQLLLGVDKKTAFNDAVRKTKDIEPYFAKKYIGSSYRPDPRKGLAINTLLLATSSFMSAGSFEEAVVKAVNLGGDADTTGAVTGALSGAYFGVSAIPQRWSSKLNPRPARYFIEIGKSLFEMGRAMKIRPKN